MTEARRSRKPDGWRPSLRRVGGAMFFASAALVAGATAASAQAVDDPALVTQGEAVFMSSCVGCHGVDGAGTNTGRPLLGIADQERDRGVHIASVTDGKGNMPAFGEDLGEDEIDAAVAYVRLTFVAERSIDELPNTGMAPELFLAGAALIAAGLVFASTARREVELTA